eukprot:109262-Hanusia_phi.AAC.1
MTRGRSSDRMQPPTPAGLNPSSLPGEDETRTRQGAVRSSGSDMRRDGGGVRVDRNCRSLLTSCSLPPISHCMVYISFRAANTIHNTLAALRLTGSEL